MLLLKQTERERVIFWPSYSLKPFFLFSKTLGRTLARFLQIKNLSLVSSTAEIIFQN